MVIHFHRLFKHNCGYLFLTCKKKENFATKSIFSNIKDVKAQLISEKEELKWKQFIGFQ